MRMPWSRAPERPAQPPLVEDKEKERPQKEPDLTGYRFGRWIVNEGLLRDEGTVCGLTGDSEGIDSKLKAIEAYYEVAAVRADRDQGPFSGRAEAARQDREDAQEELATARASLRELEAKAADARKDEPSVRHALLRQSLTMLLAGAAAACSYVLVYEALADDFNSPAPVALAVLLGGTFMLFRPVSQLFGEDAAARDADEVRYSEGWLQRVIEVVPPLIASLFTCAWLVGERSTPQVAITGVFLFTLFLFSGKLALSALTVVARAVERRRTQRRKQEKIQRDVEEQRKRVASADARLRKAWDDEQGALEVLAVRGDRREVEAIREYKKALFMSEVSFAGGAKQEYELVDVMINDDDAEQD